MPLGDITKLMKGLPQYNYGLKKLYEAAGMHRYPKLNTIKDMIESSPIHEFQSSGTFKLMRKMENFQRMAIPESASNSISQIYQQQSYLTAQFLNIKELSAPSYKMSQLASLQSALTNISSQIIEKSIINKDWETLELYKEINIEAAILTEKLEEIPTLTNAEEVEAFRDAFNQAFNDFLNKAKNIALNIKDNWLKQSILEKINTAYTLYSILITLMTFSITSSEHVTKKDLKEFKKELNEELKEELKEPIIEAINTASIKIKMDILDSLKPYLKAAQEKRLLNNPCKVFYRNNTKSLHLCSLQQNTEVNILQVVHKWTYISYFDPKDNSPATGWVMKKYLSDLK